MTDQEQLIENLHKIRKDLSIMQTNLTEVIRAVAAIPTESFPTRPKCPTCGITTRGPLALAEHEYTSHNGPVPDHYLEAELLAGITAETPAA